MFGLSFGELAIIAILALILLGPDRLPDAAKTLAKGLRELRKATDDLKGQLGDELSVVEDVKRTVTGALTDAVASASLDKPAVPLAPRGP
ncbi:MAG: twin-arginine translocase TatA/TatE family subunit, partial [Anaeromyxobacteraceae bacterium]